jgi:hypothetical protein
MCVFSANKHVDVTETDCVQGEVWAEAVVTADRACKTSQHTI